MADKDLSSLISELAEKCDARAASEGGWENITGLFLEIAPRKGAKFDPLVGDGMETLRAVGLENWLRNALEGVSAYQVKVKLKGADGVFRRTAQLRWHDQDVLAMERFDDKLSLTAAELTKMNVKFAIGSATAAMGSLQDWMERALRAETKLELLEEFAGQERQTDRLVALFDRGEKLFHAFNAGRLSLGEGVERITADPAGAMDIMIARGGVARFTAALKRPQLELLLGRVLDALHAGAGVADQVPEDATPEDATPIEGELFKPLAP